ncbi:MAG: 3-hydroxyacyl-CoA dehydrogenase NAD-binding domain-containing protein [Woeseiaceae bacterium]|nr:3-hydroxyacyl-CoA dehydrogenase NAD-binding domain-containing protein [Woeseiaceae bacterium]
MNSPVSYEREADIGVILIDNPPVNAMSQAVRQGVQDAIRAAQADDSKAVVILCAGRTFVAGADIKEFGKPPKDPWLPELLAEVEASAKPVVAAIHGTALGGGFELCLASHYRCALASAKVGLPEVKLGLLPGAGGTQRTPRLAGVAAALDLMTSGTPIGAESAQTLGLIDRIVEGDLRQAALAYARELVDKGASCRRSSELPAPASDQPLFAEYRRQLEKKARGQIAPQRIVDCVEAATMLPFPDGMKKERETFLELMAGPQSAGLRHLFFAEREAGKIKGIGKDTPQREVKSVGVIGAGTMGSGIAMNFANAGLQVSLVEVNDDALGRGLETIARNYAGGVKRGKMTEQEAIATRERITGSTDFNVLADVDLVVEAVFEDLSLKQDIFERLDETCKQGAILATNTSYQDVNKIAAVTRRAEDVIGLHFFSPAHIMKLLEVVRADKTADDVLATCMALAKRIRKIPVVAGVCYGFIGNRMLQHYGREAQLCLIEGATPDTIDTAMQQWGMAMGPLRVFDLAGLDVGYKARQGLPEEERGDPRAYRIADALVEMGRLGQKSGAGFYRYDAETRDYEVDAEVLSVIEREAEALGVKRRDIDASEIVDRLIYALINEGLRIVDEGIAQRPSDIDVVYAYGYGFPPHRGGPMHYADSVGLEQVHARISEFRARFGPENWTPAPLLERLIADKQSVASLNQ